MYLYDIGKIIPMESVLLKNVATKNVQKFFSKPVIDYKLQLNHNENNIFLQRYCKLLL